MSLCVICMTRKATVPDKNRPGKPVNRWCLDCHGQKLIDDFLAEFIDQRAAPVRGRIATSEGDNG